MHRTIYGIVLVFALFFSLSAHAETYERHIPLSAGAPWNTICKAQLTLGQLPSDYAGTTKRQRINACAQEFLARNNLTAEQSRHLKVGQLVWVLFEVPEQVLAEQIQMWRNRGELEKANAELKESLAQINSQQSKLQTEMSELKKKNEATLVAVQELYDEKVEALNGAHEKEVSHLQKMLFGAKVLIPLIALAAVFFGIVVGAWLVSSPVTKGAVPSTDKKNPADAQVIHDLRIELARARRELEEGDEKLRRLIGTEAHFIREGVIRIPLGLSGYLPADTPPLAVTAFVYPHCTLEKKGKKPVPAHLLAKHIAGCDVCKENPAYQPKPADSLLSDESPPVSQERETSPEGTSDKEGASAAKLLLRH